MQVVKKLLLSLIFVSSLNVYASYAPEYTQELPPEGKFATLCNENVHECISYFSKKYDVPRAVLDYIISNESSYRKDAVGDMDIICKRTGKPVRARGILQITECYYPNIPDECAFDVECSLEKMILLIKDENTCRSQWTTCRNYFNQGL